MAPMSTHIDDAILIFRRELHMLRVVSGELSRRIQLSSLGTAELPPGKESGISRFVRVIQTWLRSWLT